MPASTVALHLLHGWWVASCPTCGHELGRRRDQAAAERAGERRRCPVCTPEPERAGRLRCRRLRLDGPLAEFHRAVDRLRFDTRPGWVAQPPADPPPPPPRRRDPSDRQGRLLDQPPEEGSA
jgi:hypothetical protein